MSGATNLVGGLSAEIERVRLKQERWEDYVRESPELGDGMRVSIAIMAVNLANARTALNGGEIIPMMAALKGLRDYNDDD